MDYACREEVSPCLVPMEHALLVLKRALDRHTSEYQVSSDTGEDPDAGEKLTYKPKLVTAPEASLC